MPGTLGHLGTRFFDILLARPLDEAEMAAVQAWVGNALAQPFFEQPAADQRHGYEAGLSVLAAGHAGDVVIAAAMHDVGKRKSGLGILGRTAASLMILLGLPLSERMLMYRDHGLITAKELAELGAPAVAIDFAMHHHGTRPVSIDAPTWDALVAADHPKTPKPILAGIPFGST